VVVTGGAGRILDDTWRWIVDNAETISGALGIERPVIDSGA